ncbi:MAG: ribonuclease P protein component [Pseudonocardiales bacterium]|nr:ribonuclease P protein component [Pseudonocardiales bacterium]
MLPAAARLIHRDDFTAAVRRGRRVGRRLVVMHVLLADTSGIAENSAETAAVGVVAPVGARVGFVVSKAVGGSVVRHRVARRLRHLMRQRLAECPPGARIVVRALPTSAGADSATLGLDLDRALRSALSPGGSSAGTGALSAVVNKS